MCLLCSEQPSGRFADASSSKISYNEFLAQFKTACHAAALGLDPNLFRTHSLRRGSTKDQPSSWMGFQIKWSNFQEDGNLMLSKNILIKLSSCSFNRSLCHGGSGNLDWWVLGVLASYRQSHHRHRNQSSMAFKARSDSRWTSRQQIDHERELLTSKSMFTQIDCGGKHHFIYEVNHFGFLRQSVE